MPTEIDHRRVDRLATRWAYWLPLALIASKQLGSARTLFNPSQSPLNRLRLIHEQAIKQIAALGIPWDIVSKHELDDPRLTEQERSTRIGAAQERSRCRPNNHSRKGASECRSSHSS